MGKELEHDEDIDETPDTGGKLEDLSYDELLKRTQTAEAQKRHWRDKAKTASQPKEKEPKAQDAPKQTNSNEDEEWRKRIEFVTTSGRDLSSEEVQQVMMYAKGSNTSYEEALGSPMIKSFLEGRKREETISNATPSSSRSSFKVQGKNWHGMNAKEKQANFQAYQSSLRKK